MGRELCARINSHTLYAMLKKQNPSSKFNSKPHYSSQPMDQTPKFLLFLLPSLCLLPALSCVHFLLCIVRMLLCAGACVCVCACACVCVCVSACVHACVHACTCVREWTCVCAYVCMSMWPWSLSIIILIELFTIFRMPNYNHAGHITDYYKSLSIG